MRYIIVTPVKNEERFIARTIESVAAQTVLPQRWIIVDDSSTDNTRSIIESYRRELPFMELMNRSSSKRDAGYGGVRAFNSGVATANVDDYDFIVNLDGDVSFEPHYFERLFERFSQEPRLGIAGGQAWAMEWGHLRHQRIPDEHVPGFTKVYRCACYKAIAPIRELPSWDTVDEIIARAEGWKTQSFRDIRIMHLKPMALGASNVITGRFIQGKVSQRLGYRADFLLFRAIKMSFEYPYIIGGLTVLIGYLASKLKGEPMLLEPRFINELRSSQAARLRSLKTAIQRPFG